MTKVNSVLAADEGPYPAMCDGAGHCLPGETSHCLGFMPKSCPYSVFEGPSPEWLILFAFLLPPGNSVVTFARWQSMCRHSSRIWEGAELGDRAAPCPIALGSGTVSRVTWIISDIRGGPLITKRRLITYFIRSPLKGV
ncbi:hypothetical protein HJG60_010784 [Phyllostomus discolor]|uniref:Uncharacterized protein n=1 Tax=Phyllostomus discolor TaxID=89673 RepID=A0A834EA41_9CHIR|nr:hypothetical protein HJG60_010784 [Phyllostomus discolor]